VFSAQLAKKMFDETGCNGILVARGSLGNPWIFNEIKQYLKNGKELPRPDTQEIIRTMIEHLDSCVDFFEEKYGVVIFRKFFGWYTKGFKKIRPLREKVCRAKTREQVVSLMKEIYVPKAG